MKLHTRKIEVVVEIEDAKFTGSPLSPQQIQKIQDKHQKIIGRGKESKIVTDSVGQAQDIFVAMVVGWENVQDIEGNVMECTPDNKRKVFEYDQKFVEDVISAINAAVDELRGAERKN